MANELNENPITGPQIEAGRPKQEKRKLSLNVKCALFLAVISFALYANTLKNGYALDDVGVITSNTIVKKGISAIPELLSTPRLRGFLVKTNDLYRPLSLVLFATEYQFFGEGPLSFHLVSILLFTGCVILLFLFFDQLFEQKKAVAFIAALLFALHPIHTEVVANIKSCDELLCFFFAFLCLNVFMSYIRTGKISRLLLGSFCFLLSFLAKETVITFLAIFPLVFFFYRDENKKRSIHIMAGAVLVTIIALAARFSVLSFYHADHIADIDFLDNILSRQGLSFGSRIATAILILGYYLKLLFIPHPLIWDYSYSSIPFVGFDDYRVLVTLFVYAFLFIFSIARMVKHRKDPYAFGILFFLVTISIFSNIPFLIGSAMGERFLFFPSVGFCVLIALLLEKWTGNVAGLFALKRPRLLAIIIPISLVYAVLTFQRNGDWLDDYTLYKSDVEKAPDCAKANYFYGSELEGIAAKEQDPARQKEMIEQGIIYLNKALAIYPPYDIAESYVGFAYYSISKYDSAELHYRRAVKLNPGNTNLINNLAELYIVKREFSAAIELYRDLIGIDPHHAAYYCYAGLCYKSLNKYDSAIYYLDKAISVDRGYKLSYKVLARLYKETNNSDSANKYEAILKAQ